MKGITVALNVEKKLNLHEPYIYGGGEMVKLTKIILEQTTSLLTSLSIFSLNLR